MRFRDRTTANEPVGKRTKLCIKGTRTARRAQRSGAMMKRTEKSKANSRQKSKANSRQKSKANGRQDKSRANSKQKQTKGLRTETRRSMRRSSTLLRKAAASRPRCPAGAIRAEAWRNDHDYPKDRLRRRKRGVQKNHPDSSEAETQKVQKIVKIPHVEDREHRDAFSQLEAMSQLSRQRQPRCRADDLCRHQGGSRAEHYGHSGSDATTSACDSEAIENGG